MWAVLAFPKAWKREEEGEKKRIKVNYTERIDLTNQRFSPMFWSNNKKK